MSDNIDKTKEEPEQQQQEGPQDDTAVTFAPTQASGGTGQDLFAPAHPSNRSELMGPLLRRKKVISMPLGAGGDFFVHEDVGGPHRQLMDEFGQHRGQRQKQGSYSGVDRASHLERQRTPPPPRRTRQTSQGGVLGNVLRRKQVSLDLLGPNDFFATPSEADEMSTVPMAVQEEGDEKPTLKEDQEEEKEEEPALKQKKKDLFLPLRFSPRLDIKTRLGGGGHGGGGGSMHSTPSDLGTIDEETSHSFDSYSQASADLQLQVSSLMNSLKEEGLLNEQVQEFSSQINLTRSSMEEHENLLKKKLSISGSAANGKTLPSLDSGDGNSDAAEKAADDANDMYQSDMEIIKATKHDKIKAAVCFFLMLALTITVIVWEVELDSLSYLHLPVGLACVTQCEGNLEYRDFFRGHNHFKTDEVIEYIMHLDPHEEGSNGDVHTIVELIGTETGQVKSVVELGTPGEEDRETFEMSFQIAFDHPDEPHILNISSSDPDIELSFTMAANVLKPLADKSEIVAALIMITVYFFILIEVIHRTLVAIIGSMIALMFYFIMHGGESESIGQLMLHLEWSTLALLFGMMLIVGELSHTGVFEWCSVRLLVASKGSFVRLMVLLCTLTAVASAFLDNVTTMLLVAPVTIDMCNILQVDPRPYLIGEVLLSNIGGTATLIGDPPNIIIGSSFEEIGFVDFIIHLFPFIFIFAVPISLVLVCWIYRYYLTSTEMRVLDTSRLKRTYPIYDEPRLMIAGTVTFFVIVMFFAHPLHHKDTAWVALLGAFICISFTNPHDVQEALRSHIEWETLLFFAGLFVLVEVCALMGLLELIGDFLADFIKDQDEDKQLAVAITLILWVSAFTSAFLDNIPYTATMIPIVRILAQELPDTLPIETLAWALSFGACLGGNGTLLGASANIVTAGISTNKGFEISFLNFLYPGMLTMISTVGIANLYMLVRYAWA